MIRQLVQAPKRRNRRTRLLVPCVVVGVLVFLGMQTVGRFSRDGEDASGLPRIPGVLTYTTPPAKPAISRTIAIRAALDACGLGVKALGWAICIQEYPVEHASWVTGQPQYVMFYNRGCELAIKCPNAALGPLTAWIVPMHGADLGLGAYAVIDARSGKPIEVIGILYRDKDCSAVPGGFTQLPVVGLNPLCALAPRRAVLSSQIWASGFGPR